MSYDTKCYELAKAFLVDEPELNNEKNVDYVAQVIQDSVENAIYALKDGPELF